MARDRGFALLVVLWSLVLIALLTTQILAAGRSSVRLAGNLREAAQAQAVADGAINEALLHAVATGPDHWAPDGSTHVLSSGIAVRVTALTAKINPNRASTPLLAGLFQAAGASTGQALELAKAIIAWRSQAVSQQAAQQLRAQYKQAGLPYGPPGHNFADLAELGDVLGMTPDLLAAAMPHMDLYQSGDPDPHAADPVVRRALILAGQTGASASSAPPVLSIEAEVQGPGQLVMHRKAIVSLTPPNFAFLALSGGY